MIRREIEEELKKNSRVVDLEDQEVYFGGFAKKSKKGRTSYFIEYETYLRELHGRPALMPFSRRDFCLYLSGLAHSGVGFTVPQHARDAVKFADRVLGLKAGTADDAT